MASASPWLPSQVDRLGVDVGPLIHALSTSKAVGFVGAGPSIDAGLPSWQQLLADCLDVAKHAPGVGPGTWECATRFLRSGDFLTVAELLQNAMGTQLENYLWSIFASPRAPSQIHYALARMPFSMVLTTNYDRLLEAAYEETPLVCNWREPEAFFCAIKNRRSAIVKTHGEIGKSPSLVLSKTSYRDLIHLNEAFNQCIKTLLTLRTFLFVGTSLRDPDLMHLFDEAMLTFGEEFGPHYAILFEDEADERFSRLLYDSYRIRALICRAENNGKFKPGERAAVLTGVLTELAGRANREKITLVSQPSLDDPLFSRRAAGDALLKKAIELTGSFRGDICIVTDDKLQALQRIASYPKAGRGEFEAEGARIPDNSIIGRLFLRQPQRQVPIVAPGSRGNSPLFCSGVIYVSDIKQASELLKTQGYADAKYYECHSDVRSELACPIYSDGRILGVLNVESDLIGAYTPYHANVLERMADQIGWVAYEAKNRQISSARITPFVADVELFGELMERSRLLKPFEMRYILWRLDYDSGVMYAHATKTNEEAEQIRAYEFEDWSLATRVLKYRKRFLIPDVEEEMLSDDCILHKDGCQSYGIRGPLMAAPLQAGGHTSAVLVSWSQAMGSSPIREQILEKNGIDLETWDERVYRLAHLIINDPSIGQKRNAKPKRADAFLKFIDEQNATLNYPGSKEQPWPIDLIRNSAEFRDEVALKMMEALTVPACGLPRVRLWIRESLNRQSRFRLWHSFTTKEYTCKGRKAVDDTEYLKIRSTVDDPYVRYSMSRYRNDPYAKHQHQSMFANIPDPNCVVLDKQKDGAWIVGLVTSGALWGFLSADDHHPHEVESKPRLGPPGETPDMVFQRLCVDVISHLVTPVVKWEVVRSDPERFQEICRMTRPRAERSSR